MKWTASVFVGLTLSMAGPAVRAERTIAFESWSVPPSGTIAVAVSQGVPDEGVFADVDEVTDGALRRAVDAVAFEGERDEQLDLPGVAPFDRIILVGTGADETTSRLLEDIGGRVGQAAAQSPAERIEILWDGERDAAAHLAFGAALGQYRFMKYRTREADAPVVGEGEIVIRTPEGAAAAEVYEEQWAPVAWAVRFVRNVITEPALEIYPESFVQQARLAFDGLANVRIVLDVPAMEKLGMGGILACWWSATTALPETRRRLPSSARASLLTRAISPSKTVTVQIAR
ncbi:MAG: M17 family peptidase N-terminal domain-containing protein [Woeseia sp.]